MGRTPLLWREAERFEVVEPGEKKAPGRPYCRFSIFKEGLQERKGDKGRLSTGPVAIGQKVRVLN